MEDDEDLLALMRAYLVSEGYEVSVYTDKNSIKGVIINRPDLVLLDERLRDGFGHELCAEIKAHPMTKDIPVILTSGLDNLPELHRDAGADDYLAKPFEMEKLLAKVHHYLKPQVNS